MTMIPNIPPVLPMPIAIFGDANVIPISTPQGSGQLSFEAGFPFITQVPLLAGGIAPARADFNAVMRMLSIHAFFAQSGGVYPWVGADADFPGLNYLRGNHVLGDDGHEYIARLPSGPGVPAAGGGFVGPINPVMDSGTYWWNMTEALEKGSSGGAYVVGDSKLWRFRTNQLPEGWYHENGDRFPEGTDEYEVLDSFTPEFKADNGITLSVIGGINTLSLPTAYYTDGRGMFRRPGTPVGSIRDDTMRPITGSMTISSNIGVTPVAQVTGAFEVGAAIANSVNIQSVAGASNRMNFNPARLGPNFSGTETVPNHVNLTPAIYLGVPK